VRLNDEEKRNKFFDLSEELKIDHNACSGYGSGGGLDTVMITPKIGGNSKTAMLSQTHLASFCDPNREKYKQILKHQLSEAQPDLFNWLMSLSEKLQCAPT